MWAGPGVGGKTAIDRGAAGARMVLRLPLFAVLAILIRRGDGGPVFFRQERIGKDGNPFPMLKFRSMVTDA